MDAQQFLAEFGHIANAPGGVARLRELILQLAVTGRLTERQHEDTPASELIAANHDTQRFLIREKKLKRQPEPTSITAKMTPWMLPDGWEWTRLGNVTNYGDAPKVEFESVSPETWVLELEDIEKGSSRLLNRVVAKDRKFKSTKNGFPDGAVLYGKLRPYLDKVLIADTAGVCTTEIAPISFFDQIDARYLRWYLKCPYFISYANGSTYGMNLPRMGTESAREALFPFPPKKEQTIIVAKVDELMALCDKLELQQQQRRSLQNNLRQSTLQAVAASTSPEELQANWMRLADNFGQLFHTPNDLLELRQCIKQLALRGFLTNSDFGEEISPDLKNAAITSSHPVTEADMDWKIPNRWIWGRTDWLGEARLGKMLDSSKNKGEPLPYLRNINVRWRKFQLTDVLTMRVESHELPKVSVRQGDLVICEGGEPGRAAIWKEPRDFVIQKALHRFRCGNNVLPEYMLLCLEHDYFSGRLSRYYTGATIKHLTGRSLAEYAIPLPPIAEQYRIVKRVDELMLHCDQLERRLGSALQIADRLAISTIATITGITTEHEEDEPLKAPKTQLIAPLRLGTPPSTKEQAPLAAILAHQNGEMVAKDLWQRFGGEIDAFYAQLKLEVDKGWIQEPEMANMRQLETA